MIDYTSLPLVTNSRQDTDYQHINKSVVKKKC